MLVGDKKMDPILCGHVQSMVALLNLFLDKGLGYTWRVSSLIATKSHGCGKSHGVAHARLIRRWVLNFFQTRQLPHDNYKRTPSTVLQDEDISQEIQFELGEKMKNGSFKVTDLVDIISRLKMQDRFRLAGIDKPSISERMAHRWMNGLGWRYGKRQNGMYIDGHERDNVVQYRTAFMQHFKQYKRRFHLYDDNGDELPLPHGFPIPEAAGRFRLILVTHDKSTFFRHDQRKSCWDRKGLSKAPKPKGDGQSLMVLDFLSADWGRLRDDKRCVLPMYRNTALAHSSYSEARIFFKPGKNRDGWFLAMELLTQLDTAIDIFEGLTKG